MQIRINKIDDFDAKFAKKTVNFQKFRISWFYLSARGLGFKTNKKHHSQSTI